MNTLLLYLTAPMQSWGHRSRFDDRDTALEPTRSGVIGLLCCALGIGRDGDLSAFAEMQFGVRVDSPGQLMTDYQTTMDVCKADGKTPKPWDRQLGEHPDPKFISVSPRHYISDARFLVGVGHEDLARVQMWEAAVRNPVWPLFLGRKSCPPAGPLFFPAQSIQVNMPVEEALRNTPWFRLLEREKKPERVRMVLETADPQEGQTRADVPISFRSRQFSLRYLQHTYIDGNELTEGGEWPCISPV